MYLFAGTHVLLNLPIKMNHLHNTLMNSGSVVISDLQLGSLIWRY